jgi:hypothetical protein
LAALHVLANAILLFLGYYWLGIGESRALTLAESAAVALVLLALTCATYGATFAYFHVEQPVAAWRTALRHLLPVSFATVVILVIYFLISFLSGYSVTLSATIASSLTLISRKPVHPSAILRVVNALFWIVRWIILPALLLPITSNAAREGWRGLRGFGAATRNRWYWLEAPLLLLCAVWLPLELLGWVPRVHGFGMEAISFVLRAGVAYLLFVVAWLALAFVTSAGKPRFTQPSTAVSP